MLRVMQSDPGPKEPSGAGHRNMATTRTYLHLAGTVFRDEAARLEERLLGEVESSTDLRSRERT
jgi:hypothetical protein